MKNFILDVDTGVDDAFALLFAARHPEINLLGVTCVDGNTNLKQVVINTLKVLDAAEAGDIPVGVGATRPLIEESRYAEYVHGKDGLGDMDYPASTRKVDPRPAAELMRDLVEASKDPVTLVPLAPLTNIALFLRAFPESAKKLERIVLMGGSASRGNATATAEFNIWHDPEAAAIVFQSGIPITMYGLDVFEQLAMNKSFSERLHAKNHAPSTFGGRLIDAMLARSEFGVTLGDYGAVAVALYPELATQETMKVVVDTTFGPNRGATICDQRPEEFQEGDYSKTWLEQNPGVQVCKAIKVDELRELWMETLSRS
jgi:pyrimidine-specific ribonucleoside hydrolase